MNPGQASKYQEAYHVGLGAWPNVRMEEKEFLDRLVSIELWPAYMADFYLAIAAGWRLDPAWVVIEKEYGPRVRRLLIHKPKSDYFIDDLWQEIVTRLWGDVPVDSQPLLKNLPDGRRPAQIIRYKGRQKLEYFLLHKGMKIAQSRHAMLAERRRKLGIKGETAGSKAVLIGSGPADDAAMPSSESLKDQSTPLDDVVHDEDSQAFAAALRDAFSSLPDNQKALMRWILVHKLQKKDAGQLLGLKDYEVTRELKKTHHHMQTVAQPVLDGKGDLKGGLLDGWRKFLQEISKILPDEV